MAATAAKNQGKFWEFHRALLKNHNALNDKKILSIANDLKLDMARYTAHSKSPESRALIQEDVRDGRKIGVRGTPSVFLNGKNVKGRQLGDLIRIVANELTALKGASEK